MGTCADKKVQLNKKVNAQKAKPQVKCAEAELENVFHFRYLGSVFAADGEHSHDVQRRTVMAMSRCGELRHVFDGELPMALKLKLYKTAVTSILTYGSEAW